VRSFPGGEFRRQISIAGGSNRAGVATARKCFFVGENGKIMAVVVKVTAGPKPSFEREAPQPLFEGHLAQFAAVPLFEYDVTSDGKRFLLATTLAGSAPPLTAVVNWDAGLKK
jgi:hypothetical protein